MPIRWESAPATPRNALLFTPTDMSDAPALQITVTRRKPLKSGSLTSIWQTLELAGKTLE